MASKIIQKEKEEFDCWIKGCGLLIEEPESGNFECGITKTVNRDNEYIHYCFHCNARMGQHKRHLVNLKEHFEEGCAYEHTSNSDHCGERHLSKEWKYCGRCSDNIKELTKMIEAYS